MKISCDKDSVYLRLPRLAGEHGDYTGQKLYEIEAELMTSYMRAIRVADYLRKQILAACGEEP